MAKLEIIKNFINKGKRKQIIFALFAFFMYLLFHDKCESSVLISAAPVVVAGAVKVAGTSTAVAGGAGAGGTAAATGSATAGGATASSTAGTAATSGTNVAKQSANAAANTAKATNSAQSASAKTVPPKTLEQQGYKAPDSLQSPKVSSKTTEMVDDTSKASKKEASKSSTKKEKKDAKKQRLNSEQSNKEEENKTDLEEGSTAVANKNTIMGCIFLPLLFFIFFPLIVVFLISPTTTVIKGFNCDNNSNSILCSNEENSSFWEKTKNLFRYGNFDITDNVIIEKLEETYTKYYNDYSVRIDIPLLLSSILVDAINYQDELVIEDENGNTYDINKVLKERFNYLDELANMQMFTFEVAYVCQAETVDEVAVYNKSDPVTSLLDNDEEEQTRLNCDESTVNTIVYDYYKMVDMEGYFDRLEENPEVLGEIYGKDAIKGEEELALLINKIKLQYNLFSIMYNNYEMDDSAGNISSELMTDANVNLQSPLKGNTYITSLYGVVRDGGRHKGIDVVSSDTNIYCAGYGVVTAVYTEKLGGNVIEITHTTTNGNKYVTQYAHLDSFLVKKGDIVDSGEVIGIMGDTGVTTGPHLHFQMWSEETKKTYNPIDLFKDAANY